MMRVVMVVVVMCGGCALGGGPVVGYGTRRGVYAGVTGVAGVTVVNGAFEVGGTKRGVMWQGRLELELNKTRFTTTHVDAKHAYPGLHLGLGYGRTDGAGGLAALAGLDVAVMRNTSYCKGAPAVYVGIEWRYVVGESQLVFAPRYETLSDICLR